MEMSEGIGTEGYASLTKDLNFGRYGLYVVPKVARSGRDLRYILPAREGAIRAVSMPVQRVRRQKRLKSLVRDQRFGYCEGI